MTREDLLELTTDIVSSHVSMTAISSDDLLKELKMVYATLKSLGDGEIEIPTQEPKKRGRKPKGMVETITEGKPSAPPAPAMTLEEAFKPDQVACMICGKKGLTTLKRHLTTGFGVARTLPFRRQLPPTAGASARPRRLRVRLPRRGFPIRSGSPRAMG